MTRYEALARASDAFDEMVRVELARTADFIRDHGGTDAEIEAEVAGRSAELSAWRKTQVAHVRLWICDPTAPSHALH